MKVKVKDYGLAKNEDDEENMSFVTYEVLNIDSKSLNYLNENLEGKTEIKDNSLYIDILYDSKMFPFQSNEAKMKIDDFIAREEIEMGVFLSSFLEDFK